MRKIILFLSILIVLTNCIRKPAKENKIILRFSAPGFIIYNKIRQNYCKKFMDRHKNVEIIFEPVSEQRYFEKLKMQISVKSAPDIFFMRDFIMDDFIKSDALLDLTPYIKNDKNFDINDIHKVLIESYSHKNKIYGLPASFSVVVTYYNKNLFKKYNIRMKKIFTWNDIKRIGKKVSNHNKNMFTITFEFYDIITLILQNKGNIFNKNGRCSVNSGYAKGAFLFLNYLINNHITPAPADLASENAYETFINNKSLMFTGGRWFSTIFNKKIKRFKYGIIPLFRNKKRVTRMDSHGWVISSKTKYPEMAYKFLKFITSKQANRELVDMGDSLPIYKTTIRKNFGHIPFLSVYMESLKYSYTVRNVISRYMNSIEFNYILNDELNNYLYKSKTIDDMLKSLSENIIQRNSRDGG